MVQIHGIALYFLHVLADLQTVRPSVWCQANSTQMHVYWCGTPVSFMHFACDVKLRRACKAKPEAVWAVHLLKTCACPAKGTQI